VNTWGVLGGITELIPSTYFPQLVRLKLVHP